MNILANKSINTGVSFFALDTGILISWIVFLLLDIITKRYDVVHANRISILSIIISLFFCLVMFIASIIPGVWAEAYSAVDTNIVDAINNAGVQNSGNDIDINLKGTIRVTEKYGIHNQIKSILFIASASAQTGAEFTEYAASKAGMVAYMKNVALKVASFGATANSLSPGGVITDLNKHIIDDKNLWEAVLKETMFNAWASVKEIAKWSYFITVVNKSMTAQDLLIDNGEAHKSNFIW